MLSRNDTPFAAIGFGQTHRDRTDMAVICVRGSYIIDAYGALKPADVQKIELADVYESDANRSLLVRVGDLIPFKPQADVTVLGTAYPPGGRAAESWDVSVAITDHHVALTAHGPRAWEPALNLFRPTWKLGRSRPAASVPLDYRHAAGGRFIGDPEGGCDPRNPIGPGILHAEFSRIGQPLRAPQIDSSRVPVAEPFATPQPQGFGPVPPSWLWRECFCGTRDEAWQRQEMPYLPADFDYRFYQTAHPDLVLPHLSGDERIHLARMVPGGGKLVIDLPGLVPVARHTWFDGRSVDARLNLDGVHLDLRAPEGPWRADFTWRGWLAQCPVYQGAVTSIATLADAVGLPGYDEFGLTEMVP